MGIREVISERMVIGCRDVRGKRGKAMDMEGFRPRDEVGETVDGILGGDMDSERCLGV